MKKKLIIKCFNTLELLEGLQQIEGIPMEDISLTLDEKELRIIIDSLYKEIRD